MSQQTPKNRVLFVRRFTPVVLVFFGVLSLLTLGLRSPEPAQAATTSSTINFQARLETSSGGIAADGNYNVEFKLYGGGSCSPATGSGCTVLWTEDYLNSASQGVRVANGYLSVSLGSVTAFPASINWDQPLYISMNIGGTTTGTVTWDGAMLPYLQLTAVPYAFRAGQLATTNTAGSYVSTLGIQAPTGGSQTFQLQDQGAAGTYDLLTMNASTGISTLGTASTLTGKLAFANGSSAYTVTLTTAAETVGNATITIPNTVGANDTVCLQTLANCTGVSGGSVGGSGTANTIAMFTGSGYTVGNSIMSQTGTTIGVAGTLQATTLNANAVQTNGTTRIDVNGNFTGGTVNSDTLNSTALTFSGANPVISASTANTGLTVNSNGTGALTLDSTGSGTVNIGTVHATAINIGTSSAISDTITQGSSNASTTVKLQGGASYLYVANAGLGINTTTPKTTLDINGASSRGYSSTQRVYQNVFGYSDSGNPDTGTFVITMPNGWTNTMMTAVINGYEYAPGKGAWQVVVGGYNYLTTPAWYNYSAQISGNAPFNSVRLGYDGTHMLILLGTTSTTWHYPKISVDEFIAGLTNVDSWGSGWSGSFVTNESSYTNIVSPTINQVAYTNQVFIQGGNSFGTTALLGTQDANALNLLTSNTARVTITSAGNVGIGTTAPTTLLSLGSSITQQKLAIYDGGSAGTFYGFGLRPGYLDFQTAGTTRMTIDSSGDVGIGNTAPAALFGVGSSSQFQVDGSGNVSTTGTALVKTANTVALQIQNANGASILTANTSANQISINGNVNLNQVTNPTTAPTVVVGAAGSLSGTYSYVVTYVTANGETGYGPASGNVSPASQQVSLTNIPVSPSNLVIARKIYRGAPTFNPVYYLVGTLNDNTTTTFTDNNTSPGVAASNINRTGMLLQNGASLITYDNYGTNGDNIAVGYQTLQGNTSGTSLIALGYQALQGNTTGTDNTALGYETLFSNTTGADNIAMGYASLYGNTSGDLNVGIGYNSLYGNTTGGFNAALGVQTLLNNTTGSSNVALGSYAMESNTTGSSNIGIGEYAGGSITTGSYNIAIGEQAGYGDKNGRFQTLANLQNAAAIGAYAQVQKSNTIALGSVDNATQVVVGATVPVGTNSFGVSPVDLNSTTITASQTSGSGTITASAAVFSASNVGEEFVWADGTTETITAYTDTTHVTGSSTTITETSSYFRTHHIGFQVTNQGNAYIQNTSTTAFQVQNANAYSVFNVNTSNNTVNIGTGVVDTTPAVAQLNVTSNWTDTSGDMAIINFGEGAATNLNSGQLRYDGLSNRTSLGALNNSGAFNSVLSFGYNTEGVALENRGSSASTGLSIINYNSAAGIVVKPGTGADRTDAFQIQNASGSSILNVDTSGSNIQLNANTTLGATSANRVTFNAQILGGSLVFQGATDDAYTTTFNISDPTANRTITLPNNSGVITLNTSGSAVGGTSAFVQGGQTWGTAANLGTNDANVLNFLTNGTTRFTLDTSGNGTLTGNLTANGTGTSSFAGNLQSNTLKAGSSQQFQVDTSGNVTTTGTAKVQTATNSTTALQVQNASANPVFVVDTSTNRNMVSNSGFETTPYTSGWAGTNATLGSVSGNGVYEGNRSLLVNVTTAGGGAQLTGFTTTLTPNNYNFSFEAQNYNNSGTLGVTVTGGSAACTLNTTTMSTAGYQRYNCSISSSTTNITAITITATGTGQFYLDAVQLSIGSSMQQYNGAGAIQLLGLVDSPVTVQAQGNSTTAFQIQNSAGTSNLFVADTMNNRVGIGTNAPTALLGVGSSSQFQVDNSGNFSTTGTGLIKTTSTTAFQIQDASSGSVLTADSVNHQVIISGGSGTASISAVQLWNLAGTNVATLSVAPHTVGNLMTMAVYIYNNSVVVNSISGGGVTTWNRVNAITGSLSRTELWQGTVTSTGSSTITVTYSATPGNTTELVAQEFTAGLGANTSWSVGSSNTYAGPSSTTVSYPSLTPSQSGSLYWGYAATAGASSAGSTPGFSYATTSNGDEVTYDPNLSGSTTYSPTSAQSPAGTYYAVGAVYIATAGTALQVNGAMGVSGQSILGGGSNQTQLVVRANSSQSITTPLILLQNSSGGELARINSDSSGNIAFGQSAGSAMTSGYSNAAFGSNTLAYNTSGHWNTAVGTSALSNNTAGNFNIAVGGFALSGNSGSNNTAVGYMAFQTVAGSNNSALGYMTTVGYNNIQNATAIGAYAEANQDNSLVLGCVAGVNSCPVTTNVGIGNNTPASLLSVGSSSQFQVNNSGNFSTTGTGLVKTTSANALQVQNGSGTQVLNVNSSSSSVQIQAASSSASTGANMFTSSYTLTAPGMPSPPVWVVSGTGSSTTATSTNTGGMGGPPSCTTPNLPIVPGYVYNITFTVSTTTGDGVAPSVGGVMGTYIYTSGTYTQSITAAGTTTVCFNGDANWFGNSTNKISNISITQTTPVISTVSLLDSTGTSAVEMRGGSAASNLDTFVGLGSGGQNTSGYDNSGYGYGALQQNTSGTDNTAVGAFALQNTTTGYQNTALGSGALRANTTGQWNVAIGAGALATNTTGSGNMALGDGADVASGNLQNATAIGEGAIVGQSNAIVLGGTGTLAVNVGIGTTTPSAPLDVVGAVQTSVNSANATIRIDDLSGSSQNQIAIGVAGTTKATIRVDSSGNFVLSGTGTGKLYLNYDAGTGGVQIGQSGFKNNLVVYGTSTTCTIGNGTGGTSCSSDARLKTNVVDLTNSLNNVMALRPVTFTWKDPSYPQGTNLGFIAQEVQQIFPESVSVNQSSGYYQLDYASLVVPAIGAIQQEQGEISGLTNQVLGMSTSVNTGSVQTGSLGVSGGTTLQGTTNVQANLNVTGATTLSSLVVNGGVGISGDLNVGGNFAASSLNVNVAVVNGDLSVAGLTTVHDIVVGGHLMSQGATPTIALGSAAGKDGQVTISGTDTAGTLTVTVTAHQPTAQELQQGVLPEVLAPGDLADVTFAQPFQYTPRVVISPDNQDSIGLPVYITKDQNGYHLVITKAAQSGKTYQFDYVVVASGNN